MSEHKERIREALGDEFDDVDVQQIVDHSGRLQVRVWLSEGGD
jgi:hypothetical protein